MFGGTLSSVAVIGIAVTVGTTVMPGLTLAQVLTPGAPAEQRLQGLQAKQERTVAMELAAEKEELDQLIVTFLAWIVARTGLAAPEPPRIALVAKKLYHNSGDGPPMVLEDQAQRRGSHSLGLVAFYHRTTATIYLPKTWRSLGLRNQSILLHELVHHVQRFNKVTPACLATLESQAYELQVAWLREQGAADPYEVSGLDQFTIFILSACMPDD